MTTWCRVRDLSTGHHFDLPLQSLTRLVAEGSVVELAGRRRTSRDPRPPKYAVRRPRRTAIKPADVPAETEE